MLEAVEVIRSHWLPGPKWDVAFYPTLVHTAFSVAQNCALLGLNETRPGVPLPTAGVKVGAGGGTGVNTGVGGVELSAT